MPAIVPSGELAINEPVRSPETLQADIDGVDGVELGKRIHESEGDLSPDVGLTSQHFRDSLPDHNTLAPFDNEEGGRDDREVIAERQGLRGLIEHWPESAQHPKLAPHVMGSWSDVAKGRTTDHELGVAKADAVRQVGVAASELANVEVTLEARNVVVQPGLERRPVLLIGDGSGIDGEVTHGVGTISPRPRRAVCSR